MRRRTVNPSASHAGLPRPLALAAVIVVAACTPPVGSAAADPTSPAAAPAAVQPAATLAEMNRWVIAADYSHDGTVLVTAGGESLLYRPGDVVAWKAADGARIGDLSGHPTAVWAVKISRDGRLAATAGYDGLVKLWDLAGRTCTHDLKKHKTWVRSLDFSPDGSRLATAGEDGSVILWDTANGAEVKSIAAHSGPVTSIAFSPDGSTLASGGGDKLVKLWDAKTAAEKGKLEGHGDTLWAVVYSPDGSRLATAGADRTIKLWTTSDSKEQGTFEGHKDWVTGLAFSPDGTRLASSSLDGVVKLWDVATKAEQVGPEPAKSSAWCVAFSPDGKTLFVGSHAGGRLLPTPAPKLVPPPPPSSPAASPAPAAAAAAPGAPAAATGAAWIPLVPTAFTSMAGATATIGADGTVMVGGSLSKDTYTLKAALPEGLTPAAFRLEALADPSLPGRGPGRSGNGNFVVSTLAVMAGPRGSKETPSPVNFSAAKADYEQGGYGIAGAIDDKPETGWAVGGGTGKSHEATFEVAADSKPPAGGSLAIILDQQYADGTHALGRFRLSVAASKPENVKPTEADAKQ